MHGTTPVAHRAVSLSRWGPDVGVAVGSVAWLGRSPRVPDTVPVAVKVITVAPTSARIVQSELGGEPEEVLLSRVERVSVSLPRPVVLLVHTGDGHLLLAP